MMNVRKIVQATILSPLYQFRQFRHIRAVCFSGLFAAFKFGSRIFANGHGVEWNYIAPAYVESSKRARGTNASTRCCSRLLPMLAKDDSTVNVPSLLYPPLQPEGKTSS
jgi:hypothetical protein